MVWGGNPATMANLDHAVTELEDEDELPPLLVSQPGTELSNKPVSGGKKVPITIITGTWSQAQNSDIHLIFGTIRLSRCWQDNSPQLYSLCSTWQENCCYIEWLVLPLFPFIILPKRVRYL